MKQAFSKYQEIVLKIISQSLTNSQLDRLEFYEQDLLEGQVLHWLIKTGRVDRKAVISAYQTIIEERK